MLKYVKSFFVKEKDPPNPYLEWQANVKELGCSGLTHRVIETKEGKRIIITNLSKQPCTICAVFNGEQITPSPKTEKGHKFEGNLSSLNLEGEVYAIAVDSTQEIEFVRGTWTNVKFILSIPIEFKYDSKGAIHKEIDRIERLENNQSEVGRIGELLQEGYLAEGTNEYNLHRACEGGCYAIAKLLIESGINVNGVHNYQRGNGFGPFATKSNYAKETPIHIAASQGYLEIVKLLVVYGSDLEPKMVGPNTSWFGDTPKDMAIKYGHTDIQNFLATAIAEKRKNN